MFCNRCAVLHIRLLPLAASKIKKWVRTLTAQNRCAYSTSGSRVVPLLSTSKAQSHLTSEFWWYRVHWGWYGRMLNTKAAANAFLLFWSFAVTLGTGKWPPTIDWFYKLFIAGSCCAPHSNTIFEVEKLNTITIFASLKPITELPAGRILMKVIHMRAKWAHDNFRNRFGYV